MPPLIYAFSFLTVFVALAFNMSVAQQVAHQLVFHPVVSQSLKLWSTTLGRDKTYRAVQYFARFYAWFLLSRGYKLEAARWNALKAHLALVASVRDNQAISFIYDTTHVCAHVYPSVMRLAKPMEHLQAALRTPPGVKAEEVTTIGRQLCYFGYLTYDAFVWANAIRFITLKPETAQRVNKTANRFWLAGITFSIIHGLLKAGRLANEVKQLRSTPVSLKDVGAQAEKDQQYRSLESLRSATRQQFIVDLLDFWIPAANVDLITLNEGFLGMFGFFTSVLALRQQWAAMSGKA